MLSKEDLTLLDTDEQGYWSKDSEEYHTLCQQSDSGWPIDASVGGFSVKASENAYDVRIVYLASLLNNALAQQPISQHYTNILKMRFIDGKTLKEIGAELGVTGNRVMQIEQRALGQIRLSIRRSGKLF